MKHLKRFNESLTQEELQDFCESSLAYVIDEGFTVKIYGRELSEDRRRGYIPYGQFNIWLHKDNAKEFFKWDDVKDYYIPFLQLLSNRYEIYHFDSNQPEIRFRYRKKTDYSFVNVNKDFSYGRVINDNVFDSEGYWKDSIFYKWTPDPDILGIGVIIKERGNQVKLDI
jgi:hypothetical protein